MISIVLKARVRLVVHRLKDAYASIMTVMANMNAVGRYHRCLDVAMTGAATGAATAVEMATAAAKTGAATAATGMTRADETAGATAVMIAVRLSAVDLPNVATVLILTAMIWLVPEAQIECDFMVTGKHQPHHHNPPKINGKWGRYPHGGRHPKLPNGGVVADKCVGATEATFVVLLGTVPVVTPVATSAVVLEGGTSHLALLTRMSLASNAADAAMIISICVQRSINFAAGADIRVIFFVFVVLQGHPCLQIDGQNLVQ